MIRETGQVNLSDNDIDFINDLFRELKACFPAWAVHLKSTAIQDETKRQWVQSFRENGINSSDLVQKGMIHARKRPSAFFPAPGEFGEWCKPPQHWAQRAIQKADRENLKPYARLTDQGKKERAQAARDAAMLIIKG